MGVSPKFSTGTKASLIDETKILAKRGGIKRCYFYIFTP